MSSTALLARTIYTPQQRLEDGCVLLEDSSIRAVGPRAQIEIPPLARTYELSPGILAPGFLDIHVHGAGGRDIMEGSREALAVVGRTLLQHGTTAYLATTVTAPIDQTLRALETLSATIKLLRMQANGAEALPVGIHLEGPFINPVRRGVHPAAFIQPASPALLRKLLEAGAGEVRILTLAPEIEGADELIALALEFGVVVALGHSDATCEQTRRASDRGARHAVHLFNAMRPFHHREPGIVGAALTDERITAELIADGVHADPAALHLALLAKGPGQLVLVSDGTSATGMPDGNYRLGSIPVTVQQGVCRNEEGKLAGSVLTLDRALRNILAVGGIGLSEALAMATLNPARLIGMDKRKGIIAPGADADLLWLDSALSLRGTVVRGHVHF